MPEQQTDDPSYPTAQAFGVRAAWETHEQTWPEVPQAPSVTSDAPSLTVEDYAAALKLDPAWLREHFGLREWKCKGLTGVEIPYVGFGDQEFGRRIVMADEDESRLSVHPGIDLEDAVYGISLLEGYQEDT